MDKNVKIIREYANISLSYTKGPIDVFVDKQLHPHYEIYLLLNGSVEFINDHNRAKLAPYNLVIIPPGEYHNFAVKKDCISSYERCVLNIYPEHLDGITLHEALIKKEILDLSPNHRIITNFFYLKEAMNLYSEKDFEYILSAITTDIIFLIKQYKNASPREYQEFSHPLSCEIMNYINEHYKSNPSLQDIAKHFYLSVSSISHTFKNDFGVSIKQYVTEKRLNEIYLQLKRGRKPLELFQEFNFSNYSTFYRSYCKRFGLPPSQSLKK